MRRKRRNLISIFEDPGKDIFAFLFITTFIMVFVMLLSYEQKKKGGPPPLPVDEKKGESSITLHREEVGVLKKENGQIMIVLGNKMFNLNDISIIDELVQGPWIKNIKGKKILVIKEDPNTNILLKEYLSAFGRIHAKGVEIHMGK